MTRTRMNLLLLLAMLAAVTAHAADPFIVIVNAANTATLDRDAIAAIFMKRVTAWPDGSAIVPADQATSSKVRADFSRVVLRRGVDAMEAYWQQQIFSGRDIPPPEKSNDAEVLAFVRRNRGAIGYISAATNADGVRIVSWK